MIEAKSFDVASYEHMIVSWIRGFNGLPHPPVPVPDAGLSQKLGRWAKVFAIWYSHDRPTFSGIINGAAEYVGQHYCLMVPLRPPLASEADETIFNLAVAAGIRIFDGEQPPAAIAAMLAAFGGDPGRFRRAADDAPLADWEGVWNLYKGWL